MEYVRLVIERVEGKRRKVLHSDSATSSECFSGKTVKVMLERAAEKFSGRQEPCQRRD